MALQDSYFQLATSIEKRLSADLPGGAAVDLSASIDRALLQEAQRAEVSLASLRLIIVAIAVAYSLTLCAGEHFVAAACLALLAPAILWAVASTAFFFVLRRGWYRIWLRHLVPVIEAALIALLCMGVKPTLHVDSLVFATALSAYLTFAGALRLSRSSAQLSTVLAILVLLVVGGITHASFAAIAASMALLGVLGLAGGRAPELVKRVVTNEIGRGTMTTRYEEARHAVEIREQVLKIVSHDLRNPLSTIAMSSELLLEGAGAEEQRKRQVMIIRRAGDRMNRLVKDLLDVAKLESGHLSIQPRATNLESLLNEAAEMLHPLAAEKSLSLDVRSTGDLPKIDADAGRVLQVLSNLVGNAIKFTPAGGRIMVSARPAGSDIHISVEDTGPGIPPEQLQQIFGAFWQADPSDRRGIGLGLTISKAIVEAHGGRLWVESTVGKGTVFHFTLRRDRPRASEAGVAAGTAQLPLPRHSERAREV